MDPTVVDASAAVDVLDHATPPAAPPAPTKAKPKKAKVKAGKSKSRAKAKAAAAVPSVKRAKPKVKARAKPVRVKVPRKMFTFSRAKIAVKSVIRSVFDASLRAVVKDDRHIVFKGQVTTLSKAAKEIAHKTGREWPTIQGPLYWTYNGKPLTELLRA